MLLHLPPIGSNLKGEFLRYPMLRGYESVEMRQSKAHAQLRNISHYKFFALFLCLCRRLAGILTSNYCPQFGPLRLVVRICLRGRKWYQSKWRPHNTIRRLYLAPFGHDTQRDRRQTERLEQDTYAVL